MKHLLVAFIAVILALFACGGSTTETKATPFNMSTGWEIIGNKGRCILYHKYAEGYHVYWSICTDGAGNTINSSVAVH